MIGARGPALAPGVRLRRGPDGEALLLVPEGFLRLNDTAAAIAELLDGERSVATIARVLAQRFGTSESAVARDIDELLARLRTRAYLR